MHGLRRVAGRGGGDGAAAGEVHGIEAVYAGAVAVGTSVFFAPSQEDNVGVLDTTTSTFSTIDTTAAIGTGATFKYEGAAAVGTSVFFAPSVEDNV
ncbi:MAG: hypothetical protein VXY81_14875, partial [Pseudomonadota bacterium]|nr:hypothetical protein [Pseudomonadota bacterium]